MGSLLRILLLAVLCSPAIAQEPPATWETVQATGAPTARHEAALIAHGDQIFLIGGRRINPVDVFDPATKTWTARSETPVELHHFQAVSLGEKIYLVGAMNGPWPNEKPLERVVVYDPASDEFEFTHAIPVDRRRGGAGAVAYEGRIYVVGGITNGHMDGFVPWFDEYDPETGKWTTLPDAPRPRDHFQAVVIGNRLYAAAGRTTLQREEKGFDLTIAETDVFDFDSGKWIGADEARNIPTPRAGNMAINVNETLMIVGGESGGQRVAHAQVEAYHPDSNTWSSLPSLARGRHGSGLAIIGDYIYTASGSGNRGGSPELDSVERIAVEDLMQ